MKNVIFVLFSMGCHKNINQQIIDSSVALEIYNNSEWVAVGSGVIVESDQQQMILTAQHLTERLDDQESRVCNHLGCSNIEICAIQLNDYQVNNIDWNICLLSTSIFRSTKLREQNVEIGDPIIQVGYPNGVFWFNQGVVSTKEPQLGIQGFGWPGSSGSGIWSNSGELIGIVSWIPINSGPLDLPVFSSTQVFATSVNDILASSQR